MLRTAARIDWTAITGLPEAAVEGTEITLGSEVSDAGAADTHTLSWNVTKDGANYAYAECDSLSFTPDDNGTYEVTLNVTDDDGGATGTTAASTDGGGDGGGLDPSRRIEIERHAARIGHFEERDIEIP